MSAGDHPTSDRDHHTPDQPIHTEWDVAACGAVALVAVRLTNLTATVQPITLDNRLAGPVLPPRRDGVPEEGWNVEGFAGSVPPGGHLPLGYACPLASEKQGQEASASRDPPIEIRVDRSGRRKNEKATAIAVVRDLGESRPPADAVPLAANGTVSEDDTIIEDSVEIENSADERAPEPPDSTGSRPPAWLDAVEARIDRAERLDGASVAEATDILRDCGGVAGVETDAQRLRLDAHRLDALAATAESLAERADAVEIPVDALRRLA